jgi:hypothetical protein
VVDELVCFSMADPYAMDGWCKLLAAQPGQQDYKMSQAVEPSQGRHCHCDRE